MSSKAKIFMKGWAIGMCIYIPSSTIAYLVAGLLFGSSPQLLSIGIMYGLGALICAVSAYVKVRRVFPRVNHPKAPGGKLPPEHSAERRRHGPFIGD